ncbi:MAG TPA: hypothetical protein VN690_14375 [Terriglobales bacterium]|nr:hypothetical protein [Terriglobales bacterium]
MRTALLALAFAAAATLAPAARAQHLVMPSSAVVPAAHIELELGTDGNGNTTVDLKATHLAQPASLSPAAQVYMVWVQPAGGTPERKGLLKPGTDLNAEVEFITPATHFELFLTAESGPEAASPSGTELVRASVARAK